MSENTRRFHYAIAIVVLLVSFSSGCHVMHQPHVPGVVYTGGQYAVSQSLPIPPSGLTLAAAVDVSLRPWLKSEEAMPPNSFAVPSLPQPKQKSDSSLPSSDPPPTINTTNLFQELTEIMAIDDAADRDDQIEREVTKLRLEENLSTVHITERREEIISLIKESRELFVSESAQAEEKRKELANEINKLAAPSIIEPVDMEDGPGQDTREGSSPQSSSIMEVGESRSLNDPATNSESRSNRLFAHLAVVLTRKGGRRIIAPFWLVMRHAAGDITLRDGDRLDLVHFGLTELGARNNGRETVTVFVEGLGEGALTQRVLSDQLSNLSGIAETTKSGYAQLVDILVLKHVGSSGNVEEYLVPRHSPLFGDDAVGKGWVDIARLRSGDIIRFQNLQLVRDIQQGQNEVIRATADEILSDKQPNRTFRGLEEAKRRMSNAILQKNSSLPRF